MSNVQRQIIFKKSGKNFLHLLFSYVLFVFIPLIVVCIIFLTLTLSSLREKALDEQQKNLEKGIEQIGWHLDSVINLSRQLSEDSVISAYDTSLLQLSLSDRDNFRRQISLYSNANELISNLYICFQQERWMMTQDGPVLSQFYVRDQHSEMEKYNYLTLNGENFLDATRIDSAFGKFFTAKREVPIKDAEQVVLYSSPIFKQGESVPLFYVAEMRITDIAQKLFESVDSTTIPAKLLIFDGDEHLLYASDGIPNDNSFDSHRDTISLNGRKYIINSAAIDSLGWKVLLLTGALYLPSTTNPTVLRLLVIISILILVCLLLMTVFMNKHYAPLHEIYTIAQQYREDTEGSNKSVKLENEYQIIHGAMDEMITRVQHYSEKEKEYADILKANFWTIVLNHKLNSENEYIKNAEEVGIPYTGRWCVLLLDYLQSDTDSELFCKSLTEKLTGMADCIQIDHFPVHQKVCILSIYSDAIRGLSELNNYCSEIIVENDLSMMVGIGSISDSFSEIATSCFNAYSAVDACRTTGKSVLCYDVAETMTLPTDNSITALTSIFRDSIQEEEGLMASDELNRIIKTIIQSDWSITQIRHLCFDLYSITNDTLSHLGKDTGANKSSNLLAMIMNIHLQDDAIDFIYELNKLISQSLSQKKADNLQEVVDRLQKEKAFINPDFSFSVIAQEMGLSNASFTRAFQKTTGKLPMDYLMEMRIQYAQELLVSTDDSVMDIAIKAGYYSVSSFSKRFKQMTNLTPREFRQQFGKQQIQEDV